MEQALRRQVYLRPLKRLLIPLIVLAASAGCCFPPQHAAYVDVPLEPASGNLPQSYASVPGFVSMFSRDAIGQFKYFFAASPVAVEPFIVIGEFSSSRKMTTLGITLADQMAAVINNEAEGSMMKTNGESPQRIWGILQEADGYLRVHVTGVNACGERRSYVVNAQMSEPIYRALHSYVYLQ
ncbi:MAG: hypothetical protein V1782_10445 [Pseudomonadota bacterium]